MLVEYTTRGDGPEAVVMLNGWLGDHTVYAPIFDALDHTAHTYVFVDCRGYGRSSELEGEYTMLEYAQDALEVMNHLGWQSFHVVGHSMGGMAAQRLMSLAGDRVKSVVAVTPVPASGVPMEGEQLALFQGAADAPENRRAIVDFTTGGRLSGAWLDSVVERSLRSCQRDAFAGYFQSWTGDSFVEDVRGMTTPVKTLVGEHDGAITPEVMQATLLDWYPNAELEVLQNAGHYPMAEIPVNLATVIDAFVARHS
jgi:pimeloyl-ACP methyl ester carboxylesterase